jgi:hypothetical protein
MLSDKTVLSEIYVGRNKLDPSKLETCVPDFMLNTEMPMSENQSTSVSERNSGR